VNDALAEALLAEWTGYRSLFENDHSWVGDALRPVIEAAFVTPELRGVFQLTSMNRLCFSQCSDFPYTVDCPCIAAWPDEYVVQAWWAGPDEPPDLVRTTDLDLAITVVRDNLPADRTVWLGDADHRPA